MVLRGPEVPGMLGARAVCSFRVRKTEQTTSSGHGAALPLLVLIHVGRVGNLRRIVNRAGEVFEKSTTGRFPSGRRMPSCPTSRGIVAHRLGRVCTEVLPIFNRRQV